MQTHRYPYDDEPWVTNERKRRKAESNTIQRLVRKLLYLSRIRLDIVNAMGVVSIFLHDPQDEHLDTIYQTLRYLKNTPRRGVMFRKKWTFKSPCLY